MNKKVMAIFFTMLMCLTTIIIPKNSLVSASSGGKTLYVGGSSFGNYSHIQDAIDDATSGNTTIFVYDGSYCENLIVNKTINLTSESNDTIIDGNREGTTVFITADWVNLTGFSIINGGNEDNDAGIKITSNHVNISNNIIKNCDALGVYLEYASNNTLWNNTFTDIANTSAIFLWNTSNFNRIDKNTINQCGCAAAVGNSSSYNDLSNNIIDNNSYGIYLLVNTTCNNSISGNNFTNMTYNGLLIEEAVGNNVFENLFENNEIGIWITAVNSTLKNTIYHNNFINNTEHFLDESNQSWDNGYPSGGNYWDDYEGYDNFSGINQNITGSDGFGDSPYLEFDNITIDSYPLIYSWGEYTPVAAFTNSVQDQTVLFNGSYSYDRDGMIVNWTWNFGDASGVASFGYGETINHTYSQDDAYNVILKVTDDVGKNDTLSSFIVVGNDTEPPNITLVSNSPETVGFGFDINISANVTDNFGVNVVVANITYPNASYEYFILNHITGDTYQCEFNNTWRNGEYTYEIWAFDYSDNSNCSDTYDFMVSSQASISVCTLKDNYGDNEFINITDPPSIPENYTLIDRGLTWNTYYDAISGENILETYQGPVNYQEDNETWTPINNTLCQLLEDHPAFVYGYRTGNDHGLYGVYFKSNIQQDWSVAFTYNNSDDPSIHAVRCKLVGVGYVDPQSNWACEYLQSVQSSQGQLNEYSITYPGVFTGTDVTWSYGNAGLKEEITLSNTTKTILQNHPPSQYGLNDASSYLVFITKLDYQNLNIYNDSGLLDENITISDIGVEFRDVLGQFKCALPLGEAFELNNETVRQKLIYRIVHLNGNTYLLSGLNLSDLNAMTFPVVIDPTLSVNSLNNDGYIHNSSTRYSTAWEARSGTADSSSTYLSIGQKKAGFPTPNYYVYRGFVLFNTTALPSNAYIDSAILTLYKKDDYSTTDFDITIQNGQPTYPHNPLQKDDYDKRLYSGNGGSMNTTSFVSGRNNISITEFDWINETGITKFCLRSSRDISGTTPTGSEYVNVYSANTPNAGWVPKLIIAYRNQSKIKNTGSTDIKGYLLMQVQYYNTTNSTWIIDNDTVNETTLRIINASEQIGLDMIFNDIVNTWNLSYGNGTYRVYAAFRDPDGDVLQINDSLFLNASYEFNVSMDLDSDDDGWRDYDEIMFYATDPNDDDTDNDGVSDPDDIDPLIDLEVNVTIKRIYANKYSYTWCEGENWDRSWTNTSGLTNGSAWVVQSSSEASGGYLTRQNDDREGFDDIAEWDFSVLNSGIYYFWMRSHRNISSSSNVYLTWKNDTGSYRIYDRLWDDKGLGYEVSWWQNTTEVGEWKWSWYGVLQLEEGDEGTLNITNIPENTNDYPEGSDGRGNLGEYWMEVDNILITDDPSCCPSGKGIEDSDDHTIGTNIYHAFDPMPPDLPAPDFYINVTIDGTCLSSQDDLGDPWWDDDDVRDDWSAVVDVSDEEGNENVPITLELYDEDGAEDYQVDICADPTRNTCSLTYNLENATWWGDDYLMDTDFLGRTCGEVDGSGWTNGDVVFVVSQNDNDGDHITYWQESKNGTYQMDPPIVLDKANEKRAVIVGAGASCKINQSSDKGNVSYHWPHVFHQGPHFVCQGGYSWSDYTFEVDMQSREFFPDLDNEEIGVMFRYQDEDNYYLLRWKQNDVRDWMYLDKIEDGTWENLGKERVWLSKLDWYTLRINVNDENIQVDLNNNRNDHWTTKFDVTDTGSTLDSGTVALWCWENRQAWFDDVLVYNSDGDILLSDGFDYGKFFRWNVVNDPSGESEWNLTIRCVDQEDFYIMPDFVYRILLLVGHYEKDNIYYLSAARWRDADGDGENDVTELSVKENVRYGLSTWLSQSSFRDFNLVYIFDHGSYSIGSSFFTVDNNRNGVPHGITDSINDKKVNQWLPSFTYTPVLGHGRLTFVIEACNIGHFNTKIVGSKPFQHRIAISSTAWDRSAAPETGQDWPSFTHLLFKSMADGRTTFFDAFKAADYHVNFTNFMSRWAPTKIFGEWTHVAQDGKFNDNGDFYDSDWDEGFDGNLAGKTGI